MDLVEIEKARQPLAGPGRTKKPPNTAGRFYPNAVGYRKPHGCTPAFSQSFGMYRKDERCRTCGHAKRCKCKKTKGRKSTIFAARQTCAEVREKTGSYLGLGRSGAKKICKRSKAREGETLLEGPDAARARLYININN
jgi:hypothetical protein